MSEVRVPAGMCAIPVGATGTLAAGTGRFGLAGLFGGQLMAFAVRAALDRAPAGWVPYSLHASFLAPGREGDDVVIDVVSIRDGKRTCHRRVTIGQDGAAVAEATVIMGTPQPDTASADPDRAQVSPPDESAPSAFHTRWTYDLLDLHQPSDPGDRVDRFHPVWARVADPNRDDRHEGWAAVTFLSDLGVVIAAMDPDERRTTMAVSVDHTVWYLRPPDVAGWHLLDVARTERNGSRAVVQARITDRAGVVVALAAQGVSVLA